MSAIMHLMQLSMNDRLGTISEGIGYIVENLRRLQEAAKALHDAEHWQTSQIMEGFAVEEAAKVLILIDAVRCPPSRRNDLSRTVGYFDNHLAKRIYAEACSWRPGSFEELKQYAQQATRSHYLDGPKDVDWIFPNEFKARREGEIYVDYIKDVTEENGEYMWMAPYAANSLPKLPYVEPRVVATVEALWRLGVGSKHGLNIIREESQDFDPELNGSLRDRGQRIAKTLDRMVQDTDACRVQGARAVVMDNWPFPMWSLDLSEERKQRNERKADLAELRRKRRNLIAEFEQLASVREPALKVTASLVDELASAYEAAKKERDRLEDEQAREEDAKQEREGAKRRSKLRIRRILAFEPPLFMALKERLQKLTEEERADLVALAWFTRDRVANWATVRRRAGERIRDMEYTYQAGLGNTWREGYQRWKSVPKKFKPGESRM